MAKRVNYASPQRQNSFIYINNNKNKLIDKKQYQKMKRNKKVDLDSMDDQFLYDGKNKYENIAPSCRKQASGRDITYQRLRFNLNRVSPTIAENLGYPENNLPDLNQKNIFHPIDRVLKNNSYKKMADISDAKLKDKIK